MRLRTDQQSGEQAVDTGSPTPDDELSALGVAEVARVLEPAGRDQ